MGRNGQPENVGKSKASTDKEEGLAFRKRREKGGRESNGEVGRERGDELPKGL